MTLTLPVSRPEETAKTAPDFGSPKARKAIAEALAFLSKEWGFSGSKIASLLRISPTTVNHWLREKKGPLGKPPFSPDQEAVMHLLAVHRSLDAMFSDSRNQVAWLTTKHPELEQAPIDLMKSSTVGLIFVRQYLDYVRGRGA